MENRCPFFADSADHVLRDRRNILAARLSNSRIDDKRPGGPVGGGKIASIVSGQAAPAGGPQPSRQSLRGLDWFIFFLADVQTGFGPFIAVYLTTQKWTQVEIGFVLSIAGVVGLIGQMPGGAIVDAARSERLVAALAIATIGCAALSYAAWPIFPVVVTAATLHAAASCVLGPAIAAISLGLVGPLAIGERLGRNARFASLGNGVAAAVMGTCGYLLSSRSVFFVTFVLAIPTLLSLSRIREDEVDIARAHGEVPRREPDPKATSVLTLIRKRPLLIFAVSVLLLQLANAAMLPLMAGVVTTRSSQWAPVLIAACIIVPQAIVALVSPSVGRKAQQWGRRPLLLLAFAALAVRGLLFAVVKDPYVLVAVQAFDGITASVFSVMVPLIVADVAFGTGHFNLAQGIVGTAVGIGASLSTVLAGFVSDKFGSNVAFIGLAGIAALGLAMIWLVMPETRRMAALENQPDSQ
ncbi:MAG TPA: MFS transporter [Stellaceae bacterium]|nr:MFS transporter [Stellaceae bacterium]